MDTDLPVTIKAAVSLNCILSKEKAKDLIRPDIK